MKKVSIASTLLTALLSSSSMATNYSVSEGWNLLGASRSLPVSDVLANEEVRNILIYQNGEYLSTASNQFTTIPKNSGFFVYVETEATIFISDSTLTSSTVQRLDGDLNTTNTDDWSILKVEDANLLVEMKTSTYNAGLTYNFDEAIDYCANLLVGNTSGWRLPTKSEFDGLKSVYKDGNVEHFKIKSEEVYYWTSTPDEHRVRVGLFGSPTAFISSSSKLDYRYSICVKDLS